MKNRKSHTLTYKKKLDKCIEVFRAHNELQLRYGEQLDEDDEVVEINANVELKGFEFGDYTTDFLCRKSNGQLMVRECVYKKNLLKPSVIKLLDASRNYWISSGVNDWGIVLDE